nr:MAG TPA: hypothetical protein [Caudoviricetes sp.]
MKFKQIKNFKEILFSGILDKSLEYDIIITN